MNSTVEHTEDTAESERISLWTSCKDLLGQSEWDVLVYSTALKVLLFPA